MKEPYAISNVDSDPIADAMYFHLSDKQISYSIEITEDLILDIADDNSVVGIDIQHVTEVLREYAAEPRGWSKPPKNITGPRLVVA